MVPVRITALIPKTHSGFILTLLAPTATDSAAADQQLVKIISSILFKLSEQRFLHSTRFWTEVYDSAHTSCARNKLEDTRIARGNCANESNENQRQQCFEDVAVNASRGQLFCGNLQ